MSTVFFLKCCPGFWQFKKTMNASKYFLHIHSTNLMRDQDTWASWKPWSFSCGILWLSYPMPDWQFILQYDGIALLNKVLYWLYKIKSDNLFCGEIVALVVDAYTNRKLQWLPLTLAVKGFFLQLKPAIWWTSIKHYHGFHTLDKKRFFPCFSSTQRKMSAFKRFLRYFATGSDTISSQDYEGYEFVKSLLEETQIMDLFTHCKAYSIRSQLVWVLASSDFYSITWKW